MLLPRIALFFLLNAHVRTVVVASSNFRPPLHYRQHRFQENRAPEHKRQEQLFISDASYIVGQEVATVTNNGPDERSGKSFSFGPVEQNAQPDAIHSNNPLDKTSGQGEESDQLSLRYPRSTSSSATNGHSFSSVSLSSSSSSSSSPSPLHPHRHRRHHHSQFSSETSSLDQLVADPNNAQHSELAKKQAISRSWEIARKFARASNTEVPDLPGQSAAQKERLATGDSMEVDDHQKSTVFSSDAAYNRARQRIATRFFPQLVIFNPMFRAARRLLS